MLERTPASPRAGDSLIIGASAIIQCRSNYPETQQQREEIGYDELWEIHRTNGDRTESPFEFKDLLSSEPEESTAVMHRHSRLKFHAVLLKQLAKLEKSVECGKEVIDCSESDDSGAVILKEGTNMKADLVIAAHGVRMKS